MGKGPLYKPRPLCALGALVVTAGLLGGCAGAPFGQRPSLTEAQAAYQRQDYWTAAQMLRPLAYQGNAEAQYALGYMYYYGHGVKRDRGFAMSWFGEAVRLGHEKAREALAAVQSEARLTHLPGGRRPQGDSLRSEPAGLASNPASAPAITAQAAVCGDAPPAAQAQVSGGRGQEDVAGAGRKPAIGGVSAAGDGRLATEPKKHPASDPPAAEAAPSSPAPEPAVRTRRVASEEPGRREPQPAAPAAVAPAGSPVQARKTGGRPAPAAYPRFTLQLIGSRSREDLERLVARFGLEDVRYIADERHGAPWYRLLYRGFDSLAEARRALQALSPGLERHQPFVRNFPAVQMASLEGAD